MRDVTSCDLSQTGRMSARQVLRSISGWALEFLNPNRAFIMALGLERGRVQVGYTPFVCVCVFVLFFVSVCVLYICEFVLAIVHGVCTLQ